MMKRGVALLCLLTVLFTCLGAGAAGYPIQLREKSSTSVARLAIDRGGKLLTTKVNFIDMTKPITLGMVDGSPRNLGPCVSMAYTTSNHKKATDQYFSDCERLTLVGGGWHSLTVEPSFTLPLTLDGGAFGDLMFGGGKIAIRNATLNGVVTVAGEATLVLENCVFGENGALRMENYENLALVSTAAE